MRPKKSASARQTASAPNFRLNKSMTICKQRIQDFCTLAGYYRPFVFCFDQTENYGTHADTARKFGEVIGDLINECANVLTSSPPISSSGPIKSCPIGKKPSSTAWRSRFWSSSPSTGIKSLELIRRRLGAMEGRRRRITGAYR